MLKGSDTVLAKDSYNVDDILSELKEHKMKESSKKDITKNTAAKPQRRRSDVAKQTPKQQVKQEPKKDIKISEPKVAEEVSLYDIIKKQDEKVKPNAPLPISKDTKHLEFDDVPNTTKNPKVDKMEFDDVPVSKKKTSTENMKINDVKDEKPAVNTDKMVFSSADEDKKSDDADKMTFDGGKEDKKLDDTAELKEESLTDIQQRAKQDLMKSKKPILTAEPKEKKPKKEKKKKAKEELTEVLSDDSDTEDIAQNDDEVVSKPRFRDTKKGKIVISIICVLLALLIAAGGLGYWYVNEKLNKVSVKDNKVQTVVSGFTDMDVLKESFEPIYEASASEVVSYKDMVEKWYKNGKPCSSTHVLNILLIGEDTTDDSDSRADSAIICSVNIDTKTITFTSVLRDLYTYYEADGVGQFGKINGASSVGGISSYISAVENNYKIGIDNYATVNFDTFPKIIDKLGGLTIEMTKAEINEINGHPMRYLYPDKFNVDDSAFTNYDEERQVHTASVKCNGLQALAYSRIRKIDSDNMRANRQKTVLLKIMEKAKASSTTQTLSLVSTLLDYVKTGYSKGDIISIGKYALNHKWLGFKTQTYTVPTEENSLGGTYYGCWCWKADIPEDAYNLQMKIYGKSNVKLAENRPDFKNISSY